MKTRNFSLIISINNKIIFKLKELIYIFLIYKLPNNKNINTNNNDETCILLSYF